MHANVAGSNCEHKLSMRMGMVPLNSPHTSLSFHLKCPSESSSCLSTRASSGCLWIPFTSPPGSWLCPTAETPARNSVGLWDYLPLFSLSPSASVLHRHSGTGWQGTLFLIRRTAWGETLIWTSSASKRTALPGWAQRPGTANYTTLMLLPCWLIHSIKACVCVCVRMYVLKGVSYCRDSVSYNPSPHFDFFFVYICPVMNVNNAATTDYFSPHCASSRTLHIFKRVLWRPEAASQKGGSRFVQVPCLARAPCC